MGFIVSPDAVNEPWIRATIQRHEWLEGRPDVGIGYWTPNEWRNLEHQHQQRQQQQQQQQEQQLRLQQYQQRQKCFRYRQQQHQYHLQQQHETSRRWQHQQHFKQEATKKASGVQPVQVRAEGEEAQAERGGAPPTSQTTSKPQSLSGYPAVLFASQPECREPPSIDDELLECMENGLLRKPAQEEILVEELVQEPEEPQQSMHAAQPQLCSPVEKAGEDESGVLGKDLVVAGGLVVSAGGEGAEEQRPPFWDDGNFSVWWLASEGRDVGDGKVVVGGGYLGMEFGAQDSPPLQQQQQELLAPPPREPWPPPIMAVEHGGGGADVSGEGNLELERKVLFGDGLRDDEGDGEENTVDGRDWERVWIGTGAGSRAFWGTEVAGRRLTRQRRERVREK